LLAHGTSSPHSDLDLLVDPDPESPLSEILEMAGEAEEIAERRVDFVLRTSLLKSTDLKACDHILSTAVFLHGH
jgi:predicted nucleotidyltransferase